MGSITKSSIIDEPTLKELQTKVKVVCSPSRVVYNFLAAFISIPLQSAGATIAFIFWWWRGWRIAALLTRLMIGLILFVLLQLVIPGIIVNIMWTPIANPSDGWC